MRKFQDFQFPYRQPYSFHTEDCQKCGAPGAGLIFSNEEFKKVHTNIMKYVLCSKCRSEFFDYLNYNFEKLP